MAIMEGSAIQRYNILKLLTTQRDRDLQPDATSIPNTTRDNTADLDNRKLIILAQNYRTGALNYTHSFIEYVICNSVKN